MRNPWELPKNNLPNPTFRGSLGYFPKEKKKRVNLTPSERLWIWENPRIYGHICNICHDRIRKLSEVEFDHIKPHVNGGRKMALTHKACNRMKSSNSIKYVQRITAPKTKKSKKKKISKRAKTGRNNLGWLSVPRTRSVF